MPRKYRPASPGWGHCPESFNEAGADAPEIPRGLNAPERRAGVASMRPGRMPRKYLPVYIRRDKIGQASMRPGRMPRKYPLAARQITDIRLTALQ